MADTEEKVIIPIIPNQDKIIERHKRTTCRFCESSRLIVALDLGSTPLADAYVAKDQIHIDQPIFPLELSLCLDCGLSQVLEVIHGESVYLDYIYETQSSLGLSTHFDFYASQVSERLKLKAGSLVIDLGSNDGTLLLAFLKQGYKVLGVDPAKAISEIARSKGVPTITGFFGENVAEEIISKHGKAALITANNICANVDEFREFVKQVEIVLEADGVFCFESFYLLDLVRNMVFDFIYHEHLTGFSIKPMVPFFNSLNLELFDVQRVATKGGSIRCFVQKINGKRAVQPIVSELIVEESKEGIHSLDRFSKLQSQIAAVKEEVTKLIQTVRAQGGNVCGYGASATTTTLLYSLNIYSDLKCIFDDYSVKHDLFSPGCHLPVYASDKLYQMPCELLFIIAWRYAEPILRRHKEYILKGGRALIPLPEPRIIDRSNIEEFLRA